MGPILQPVQCQRQVRPAPGQAALGRLVLDVPAHRMRYGACVAARRSVSGGMERGAQGHPEALSDRCTVCMDPANAAGLHPWRQACAPTSPSRLFLQVASSQELRGATQVIRSGSVAMLILGIVTGVVASAVLPQVATDALVRVVGLAFGSACTPVRTDEHRSPGGSYLASVTKLDCNAGEMYVYRLRLEPGPPESRTWFIPLDIMNNGEGYDEPRVEWTSSKALKIISYDANTSGSFTELVAEESGGVSVTTVFARPR